MLIRTAVRRVVAASLGIALVLTAATACTSGSTVKVDAPAQVDGAFSSDVQTQMQSAVEFAMAATGSSGAIVGVWAPWAGSWVGGVGDADPSQVFRAGKETRAMTCDVLYRVASEGTVSLDDSVKKYVASIAGISNSITLRDLCDGTSGLGSYRPRLTDEFLNTPDRIWNPHELISYGVGTADTTHIGTSWNGSDAGYIMLGLALEKATGRSAAELYEQYVFGPLAMSASSLPGDAPGMPGDPAMLGTISMPGAADGLDCAAPRDVTVMSASSGFTDSGVVSTIDELGHYTQALAAGSLMPKDSHRFDDPLPISGQPSWFTVGGGVFHAGSLVGQYGSVPGYMTSAFADPSSGLTVAVVLNNSAATDMISAWLAWELAAIASKAPAAPGQTAADAGLPWTAQQFHDAIAGSAVCPLPTS